MKYYIEPIAYLSVNTVMVESTCVYAYTCMCPLTAGDHPVCGWCEEHAQPVPQRSTIFPLGSLQVQRQPGQQGEGEGELYTLI